MYQCASRASGRPTTAWSTGPAADRLSGARRAPGDRSATRPSSRRTRDGSIRLAIARSIRISCARRLQLAIEAPHRAVTFVSYACSGAEILQGLFLRYKGHEWVPNPPDLSQISAVARGAVRPPQQARTICRRPTIWPARSPSSRAGWFCANAIRRWHAASICSWSRSAATTSDFSRLLANAVLSDESLLRQLGGWFGEVQGFLDANARLDRLEDLYKSLNRAMHNILHIPWGESDRILLTSYPRLALLEDGQHGLPRRACRHDRAAGFRVERRQGARLRCRGGDGSTPSWKTRAASMAGPSSIAISNAFLGRGICAGWSDNAFSSTDDLRLPRKIGGKMAALQSGGLEALCVAAALVPHAQRRIHDRQTFTSARRCCSGTSSCRPSPGSRSCSPAPIRERSILPPRGRPRWPMPWRRKRAACWQSTKGDGARPLMKRDLRGRAGRPLRRDGRGGIQPR